METNLTTDSLTQNPKLARIRIFPFKSLPGVDQSSTRVTDSGALEYDRRFAFRLPDGRFFNAKGDSRIHRIQLRIHPDTEEPRFEFSIANCPASNLSVEPRLGFHTLERWMRKHFHQEIRVDIAPDKGFPDDTKFPGPTVISTATLAEISTWFTGINVDEIRDRFRTNLEISGVPSFWEDRLLPNAPGHGRHFQIGKTTLVGKNPCQRCVVPTRDPRTGISTKGFSRIFQQRREARFPEWAPPRHFDHFYRVAVNTIVPPQSTPDLSVGDPVRLGTP